MCRKPCDNYETYISSELDIRGYILCYRDDIEDIAIFLKHIKDNGEYDGFNGPYVRRLDSEGLITRAFIIKTGKKWTILSIRDRKI
jgi:hypothetical protein